MSSFYNKSELKELGLEDYGTNVKISRKASIYSPETISVGSNVRIDDFCILSGDITLGDYIHIAPFCGLWGRYGIQMDNFSGLSSHSSIYSSSDNYTGGTLTNPTVPDKYRPKHQTGKVWIKEHVLIGSHCVVLPDITIHEYASVGAMSLVNKDLPCCNFYAGVPVKYISERDCQTIQKLERELKNER